MKEPRFWKEKPRRDVSLRGFGTIGSISRVLS